MSHRHPIALLLGPTASGKTTLALELARRLPGGGECVCADSMQVYRGMDIGTAKPTREEQAAVPHHLLDVADPAEDGFSVDTWLDLAENAIDDIRQRRRHPIVVGGTNLYVKALLEGLLDGPAPDTELRSRLLATDTPTLRARLETVDPAAARRIHPNDHRRTVRAIEVHTLTGRPLSEQQSHWDRGRCRRDVRIIGLEWPTPDLNRRINARVRAMVEAGLVEEVRALWAAGSLGPQAAAGLGYRQVIDHLEGRTSLDDAIEQIKIRTRRFGKQQRTWLRRFRLYPNARWLAAHEMSPQVLAQQSVEWTETHRDNAEIAAGGESEHDGGSAIDP